MNLTNRTDFKQLALLYATPLLLVLIAAVQIYLAHTRNLTSWHGGGFGMFAQMPAVETRQMSVTLITPDGEELEIRPFMIQKLLPMEGWMARYHREILAMPSEARVRALAGRLAAARWVAVTRAIGGVPQILPQMEVDFDGLGSAQPLSLQAVRVTVWQYDLDTETGRLVRSEVLSVTAEAESGGDERSR